MLWMNSSKSNSLRSKSSGKMGLVAEVGAEVVLGTTSITKTNNQLRPTKKPSQNQPTKNCERKPKPNLLTNYPLN